MSRCRKETSFKYRSRRSPQYSANKCKSMKKLGNDGNLYKSVSNKKGVYRWIKVNKNTHTKKISLRSLKNMASRYQLTTSGTKKQIAKRILLLRSRNLKVKDKKHLNRIL